MEDEPVNRPGEPGADRPPQGSGPFGPARPSSPAVPPAAPPEVPPAEPPAAPPAGPSPRWDELPSSYWSPPPGDEPAVLPGELAPWGLRVVAGLVDALLLFGVFIGVALVATSFGFTGGNARVMVLGLGEVAALGYLLWQLTAQGRTGQTLGKRAVGLQLVGGQDGRPVGPQRSLARQVLHAVDALPCGLGYLRPLWDPDRQTFADKVLGTVVVVVVEGHPT